MEVKPAKILACGDVQGNFVELAKRVKAIVSKSGPFDALFCVGEFFGDNDDDNEKVVNGIIEFPISTYILGPSCERLTHLYPTESIEFSSNVTFLGKKGLLNTASGLQVAYLSGVEGPSSSEYQFDKSDMEELLVPVGVQAGFSGIDLLLTSMWPSEVSKHSHNVPGKKIDGSLLISRLAAELKPRYHFAGNGVHYERQPYRNHRTLQGQARHVTRFIGLAPVGNFEKQKWLYACNVKPMRKLERNELVAQPPNTSEFPYDAALEELKTREILENLKENGKRPEGAQYRFDMTEDGANESNFRKRRNDDEGPRDKRPAQPCWFCLSNVDAEKHLVVSIGDSCYVAMPKGPLTDDHVMILSINHIQSLVSAPVDVRDEVEKYKNAFTLAADKAGKAMVAFERNYKTQHLQVQLVPVPKACTKALKGAFMNGAALAGFDLALVDPEEQLSNLVNEGCPYFMVELPDGSRLFTRSMKSNFPLQFAREVLAGRALLDCEAKVDWRACALDKVKEVELVDKVKKSFKPYDFAIDSD